MRRLIGILVLSLCCTPLFAQDEPTGEFRLFYSTLQGFDFDSGSPTFQIADDSFHGGGFGFVFNLNPWFGIYSDSQFYAGVKAAGLDLKLINQMQGVKLTARQLGGLNLYGKAGMGFARFVFSFPQGESVSYQTSFNLAGGLDIKLSDGFYVYGEVGRTALSLPNLTGLSNRDKWDGNLALTTGIAFMF